MIGLLGDHEQRDVLLTALAGLIRTRPVRRIADESGLGFGGGGFAGGESPAHRKLKEFVAQHPERIGLPKGSRSTVEFPYLSGDQVDVKFDLPDGRFAVVEIETIDGWTGAHQCIKYRALLEAEKRLPLGSGEVDAILVAHRFDEKTLRFAKEYGIRTVILSTGARNRGDLSGPV